MKLFQLFMSCFLLVLSAFFSFVYADSHPDDTLIDYLSLNEEISTLHEQSRKKENEFNNDILLAANIILSGEIKQLEAERAEDFNKLEVVATAYTSHVAQTDNTPMIAAWGDRLKPSTKSIAVSRDLLTEYGLKHRSKVRIKGLSGEFLVLDKMNKRWRKKIDIYMGINRKAAFKWGKRKVVLLWSKKSV